MDIFTQEQEAAINEIVNARIVSLVELHVGAQEASINAIVSARIAMLIGELVERGQLPPHGTIPHSAARAYASVDEARQHVERMGGE